LDKKLFAYLNFRNLNKDKNDEKLKIGKHEEYRDDSIETFNQWIASAKALDIPILQYIFLLAENISSLSAFDLICDCLEYVLKLNPELIKEKICKRDPIFYAFEHLAEEAWLRPIIEILLEHGADPNGCDENGWTVLHLAIKHDKYYVFKVIANEHADLMLTTNKEKLSLLHLACFYGNKQIFDYLLDHRVDVNCIDLNGDTPLHFAAGCGLVFKKGEYKQILLPIAQINYENKDFYEKQINIRKYMIKRLVYEFDASFSIEDNGVLTPQDFAELFGHKELLDLFAGFKKKCPQLTQWATSVSPTRGS
jgi:hypothetical protein